MLREIARQQIVDADDRAIAVEELFGQVRADESSGSCDDDAAFRHEAGSVYRVRTPRKSVIHMILRSSETDQFSM